MAEKRSNTFDDEDVIELLDSDGSIEVVEVHTRPKKKLVREEDLDYEDASSEIDEFSAEEDNAQRDSPSESEAEFSESEDSEDEPDLSRRPSSRTPQNKPVNNKPKHTPSTAPSSKTNSNDTPPTNATHTSTIADPPQSAPQSTMTNQIELITVSIVPQNEYRKTISWGLRSPFYRLINEFKEPVVLVVNGEVIKPYTLPERIINPGSTPEILLLTKTQYQEIELTDDPKAKFNSLLRGENEANTIEINDDAEEGAIPIKLEGVLGSVRVMVTPQTSCKQLIEHYMTVKNSPPVKIKFEGDIMDDSDTVEDMDLEADDMVDVV